MRPGTRHLAVPALALALALGLGHMLVSAANPDDYKIIVHPDNPVTAIDRPFLRDAYLRKSSDWDTGATIRPIDLAPRFRVRERFVHEVLKKSPSQLRSYWNQQIFSGKGVPPPEAESIAALVAYVLANPGAVGYLPLDADPGGAKVIKVN
jgi:ABC-type phosphate transport system substrate-binding protein